jgi:hypothetical protein
MEYEIYYLCNLLGVFLVLIIVLFHFVDARDKKMKIADEMTNEKQKITN